jgi:hypothetical protein
VHSYTSVSNDERKVVLLGVITRATLDRHDLCFDEQTIKLLEKLKFNVLFFTVGEHRQVQETLKGIPKHVEVQTLQEDWPRRKRDSSTELFRSIRNQERYRNVDDL